MIKERLQEILEFTKSESPYTKANKGWINEDIFLEFGKSSSSLSKQKEAAKVTFLWPPIQRLISNLLLIIIISSLIVLSTIKGAQLNLNLGSLTVAFKNKLVQLDTKKTNLILEENPIIDSSFNSEEEYDLPNEESNILLEESPDEEDSFKLEDNVEDHAKDQKYEKDEDQLEEVEIKNDISITSTNKSKSNFF
mgnify:CR=1 FL=1